MFYVGDKYKILGEILKYFPDKIDRFIEPFVGGGSVFLNVQAQRYLLNDINSYVVNLHKFLAESALGKKQFFDEVYNKILSYNLSRSYKEDVVPFSLKQEYKKTYYAKYNNEGYANLKHEFNNQNVKDNLDLYLLLIYGFNRMLRFNSRGEFNLPVGNVDFNNNVKQALDNYFEVVVKKNIFFENLDYKDFIAKIDLATEDFIYLDPPYLITSSEYNKLWSENHEMQLLQMLDELNDRSIRFAISNVTHYKDKTNEMFLEWSKKYNSHAIKSNYISYHDNSLKNFSEVLITNY